MKKDLFTLICMALVCATVMFGIMGIYRLMGDNADTNGISAENGTGTTAFKTKGMRGFL
jgi:hypothetical protein